MTVRRRTRLALGLPSLLAVRIVSPFGICDAPIGQQGQTRRQRGGHHRRRRVDVVRLATVAWDAVHPDLHLGWVAEMGLVEVLGADVQRCQLWQRRRRTQTALLDILYLVVRNQMLCNTTYGERKRLQKSRRENREGLIEKQKRQERHAYFFHQTIRLELVAVRQTTHENSLAVSVPA